jgi:hypothetical protein
MSEDNTREKGIKVETLATVAVPEEIYKADLEITNLFQAFSSELLRAALLGIAGYGFLISKVAIQSGSPSNFFQALAHSKILLAIGVVALGFSAAFALAHRYFSSDCLVHQVTLLRLALKLKEVNLSDKSTDSFQKRFSKEKRGLRRKIRFCQWCMALSSVWTG